MTDQAPPPASLMKRFLSLFGRTTSSGRYVPEIDGLRCLAIVLVVLFHCHYFFLDGSEKMNAADALDNRGLHLINFIIAKGWFGVQIFFVISGMVLALPYASHYLTGSRKPQLKRYFRRRLIRIEAPYLLTLTLFFLYYTLMNGGDYFINNLPHYGAGLIYAHTLFYDGALNPVLTVSWTLEIEVQFYLLAPLLCSLFAIKPAIIRRLCFMALALVSTYFSGWCNALYSSGFWGHSLIGQFSYFIVGLLLADLYISYWQDTTSAYAKIWDAVGLLVWPLAFILIEYSPWIEWKPFALLIGFTAVLRGHYLRKLFSIPWITAIGAMCYTIYLFHSFLFYQLVRPHIIDRLIPITPGEWPFNYLTMFILGGITIAFCSIIFLVVEKPFAQGRLFKKNRNNS
ncbi:acyltransferase [Rubritalea halochordaticola]